MNITYTPTYPILIRNSDSTYLVTYSVLITIRISDAQTDAQNVPVDGESLIRKLVVMLM